MAETPLRFIGIDPNTGQEGSPTIWIDETNQEIVLQGWEASPDLAEQCAAWYVPGHAVGIPDGETVIRIPARMAPMLREACDVAERTAAAQLR